MGMDMTLKVTPEGSLCDLSAAVGGTEETAETPKTHLKVATEGVLFKLNPQKN